MIDKIKATAQSVKDFVQKWWFLASTFAAAVLYYLWSRDQSTITDLHNQVQVLTMKNKLEKLNEVAENDQKNFDSSRDSYDALKRQHPELFSKLGITPTEPPTKPAA